MKIAVRGGHTELCTGARALLDELTEDRKVKDSVIKYLRTLGHEVLDVTPPVNYTSISGVDLSYGVNKANEWGADLFASFHFNKAYDNYNGALGSEVCVYSAHEIAQRVVDALASLGFKNRGQKIRKELYELRNTSMKSMIVETCFVEATKDVELYKKLGADAIGKAIAEAIVNDKSTQENPIVNENKSENVVETKSEVQKAKEYVGSRCRELQTKLIALGYNCGGYGADSQFGQGTYNSLTQFQKDNGLDPDGLAGVLTFAKLDELIAKKNSNSGDDWIRRLQQECNAQGFSNQKVDGIAGVNTLNGCPTLRQGARGNITKLLQEKLVSLGYNTNGVDSIYGAGTASAVYSYQKNKGLVADKICGQATWRKLLGL